MFNVYCGSASDNIRSASSTVIRFEGRNRINPRVIGRRGASFESCTSSINLLSNLQGSESVFYDQQCTQHVDLHRHIDSHSICNLSLYWEDSRNFSHRDDHSIGRFSTNPIMPEIRTSVSPKDQNGYAPNKSA